MAIVKLRTLIARYCLLTLCFSCILYLFAISYLRWFKHENQILEGLQESRVCIMGSLIGMEAEDTWLKTPEIVNNCSHVQLLNLKGYSNADEIKYHVLRKSQKKDCAVVTLGVGRDVGAELQMKDDEPSCKFFGADPVNEFNKDLYSEFGTFFHTAVGGKNGAHSAMVLNMKEWAYFNKTVPFLNFYTFIQDVVKISLIDQLLIDIEYSEYELFPLLLKSKRPANVVICQINLEIHTGTQDRKVQFQEFLNSILNEGEYIPLKAATMLGHIRLYLLNVADQECRQRYIVNAEE